LILLSVVLLLSIYLLQTRSRKLMQRPASGP
jgi:hypothetical protein